MNEDVWILLGVFLAGSIAGMFRSFFFVLAGERLVARLRQRVCKESLWQLDCFSLLVSCLQLFGSVMKQEVAFFDVTRLSMCWIVCYINELLTTCWFILLKNW